MASIIISQQEGIESVDGDSETSPPADDTNSDIVRNSHRCTRDVYNYYYYYYLYCASVYDECVSGSGRGNANGKPETRTILWSATSIYHCTVVIDTRPVIFDCTGRVTSEHCERFVLVILFPRTHPKAQPGESYRVYRRRRAVPVYNYFTEIETLLDRPSSWRRYTRVLRFPCNRPDYTTRTVPRVAP